QPVLEQLALEQAAAEVAPQARVMHREQLDRNQAPQLRAALDVISLGHSALHRFAPQRPRVLLEAADQPREFAELAVAREMSPELQPFAGGEPAALAELQAEVMAVLRDAVDLLREAEAFGLHPAQLAVVGMIELLGDLARLLVKARLGDLRGPRGRLLELLDLLLEFLVGLGLAVSRRG